MSPQPTSKQRKRMVEGFKFVGLDLTTRGSNRPDFRYHLGAWHTAEYPDPANTRGCPRRPGDGLCVAHTVEAASSGGQSLSRSIMLLVGYLPEDVLGHELNEGKVRVRRLWVEPDPIDPIQLALWTIQTGGSANLRSANLYGANLYGANLYGANLYGANLYGANLYGANLRSANLYGANLYDANLRSANLYGANLYGANLRSANLRSANLYGANLYGANLRSANLRSANLRSANLRSANLRSANLYDANLYGANLYGANLRSANLYGANLYGAKGDSCTSLPAGLVVRNGLVVQA